MVSFKLQALFMTVVAAMVSAHPSLRDYTDISGGSDTPYCSVETVNDESKIRIMYEFTQSGNTFTSAEPSDSATTVTVSSSGVKITKGLAKTDWTMIRLDDKKNYYYLKVVPGHQCRVKDSEAWASKLHQVTYFKFVK